VLKADRRNDVHPGFLYPRPGPPSSRRAACAIVARLERSGTYLLFTRRADGRATSSDTHGQDLDDMSSPRPGRPASREYLMTAASPLRISSTMSICITARYFCTSRPSSSSGGIKDSTVGISGLERTVGVRCSGPTVDSSHARVV